MARAIKISSGILNIRLHPHPPEIYRAFMEALYRLKRPVKVRGEKYAIFSLLDRSDEDDGILAGTITTFMHIDTEDAWFDAKALREATQNQVSSIKIPDGVFPNSSSFYFIFDTKLHRLFVQTYSRGKNLSIKAAQMLVETLSADQLIVSEFGRAKVSIVQSKAALDGLFSLRIIKRIIVTVEKPNADIFEDDFDERMESYLEDLNTRKLTLTYEAEPGKSINPTKALRRLGESALEHGSVRVEGRDARGATQLSTESFPKDLHDKYDPEDMTESYAFRKLIGR